MEETKTFVIPEQSSGVDPNVLAMMNNGGCNGMWNNPFMYLIWLAIFGRNGGLFGNNTDNALIKNIQDTLNSQATNNLVMDAIKGNADAVSRLAAQLGVSTDQINSALCGINNNITSQGFLNQLASCQQTNAILNSFSQLGYQLAEQECKTRQNSTDNTLAILSKIDQVEDSRKDREIASLTAQLAQATARAERLAELAPIVEQLDAIRGAQPSTTTIQYPQLTAIPTNQINGITPYTGYWG